MVPVLSLSLSPVLCHQQSHPQTSRHLHPPHPQEGETSCSEEGTTGHALTHLTGKSMAGRKEIDIALITASSACYLGPRPGSATMRKSAGGVKKAEPQIQICRGEGGLLPKGLFF